ncbi:YhgE/Pip domain-containing protein [Aestuariimicrobium kwangyangense]|uniref:YhgE/Pip domain-containing protein n=1 Tax=Aestuariimicrobium kwangyangense TaxID=396389 RepID=UPI0012F7A4A6|nr:YhgE/Pip family protein [Aestuariimicrobium kwangyangense]
MPFPLSRLARFELRRFRGPLPTIALVFVLCVPLLYAAIYLSANWDPYGRLGNLPVAVVNEDVPTQVEVTTASGGHTTTHTETIHAGADFVKELQAKRTFRFITTDAAEAEDGLREGRYYLTIQVPADFSTNLVSGQTDSPERAHLTMHRNDANGFVHRLDHRQGQGLRDRGRQRLGHRELLPCGVHQSADPAQWHGRRSAGCRPTRQRS